MNLRSDEKFVEDEGWHKASAAYLDFLKKYEGQHVLFLEIGVGSNTPVIIKYYSEAYGPRQIEKRSVCIDGDSGEVIEELLQA